MGFSLLSVIIADTALFALILAGHFPKDTEDRVLVDELRTVYALQSVCS